MNLTFLHVRLEGLLEPGVVGMLDHAGKAFDDLVLAGEKIAELGRIKFAHAMKVIGGNESHWNTVVNCVLSCCSVGHGDSFYAT